MYRYIAIERQFCSGGQEIAGLLAKKLGYKLCDHIIRVETAKRMELPAFYISDIEETAADHILFNLAQTPLGGLSKNKSIPLSEQIFEDEKQVILNEAAKGNCIFVGRCAGQILESNHMECLKVFIYANTSFRQKRAETLEHISKNNVSAELKRIDKKRADFFNSHSEHKWGAREFFPISLNSGVLGIDTCVDILMAAINQ